jgi:hypothetical protein
LSGPLFGQARMLTISIWRSAKMTVKTLESPPCHPILKKTIWTTGRRSYILTRCAVIRQCELQGFHCQRHRAVRILSLSALHIQIYHIRSEPSHHHCPNAEGQPSTYHVSLTVHRLSRFPRLVETRMFLTHRLVEITTFPHTKRLHLR